MQSRAGSLLEAVANVAVGFVVALVAQIVIFPLFGLQVSGADHIKIGLLFTLVSILRSYALRRAFNWWGSR